MRRLHTDESGMALLYAIFAVVILTGLVVVFVARSVNLASHTGQSRDREAAIHVAEGGAEAYIAAMNREGELLVDQHVTAGATPTGYTDNGDGLITYDPPTGLSPDELEAWETDWALAVAGENTGQLFTTSAGEAFGIRPTTADGTAAEDLLFGVGFVPSHDAWASGAQRAQMRVIKLRINRHYIRPDHALLLGGGLTLGGNAEIRSPGCDTTTPTADACDADVHANGDVKLTGGAHEIEGKLSTSGTIDGTANTTPDGNSFSGEQEEPMPDLHARDFYNRGTQLNTDPGGEPVGTYDLCSDGVVRDPSAEPCTGALVWPDPSDPTTNFSGWTFSDGGGKPKWKAQKVGPGYFYVHHADAEVNGTAGSTARAVTIIVESNPGNPSQTGSLVTTGNPSMVSALPDVLFVVDRDIRMKGSANAGTKETCDEATETCDTQRYEGFIYAREQLAVGGTVDLAGAIIAEDLEDIHGEVTRNTAGISGTMYLDYDRTLQIDAAGIVVIEYWNELD